MLTQPNPTSADVRRCCRRHEEDDCSAIENKHGQFSRHAMQTAVRLFIVCSICGNKRCPKAEDCENQCTGSNDVAQAAHGQSWHSAVNPWAIVDAKATWFYRIRHSGQFWRIGNGRQTVGEEHFVEVGSNTWVSVKELTESWERAPSLIGPWERVR